MVYKKKYPAILVTLLITLFALVACSSTEEAAPEASNLPNGMELIREMETAIQGVNRTHFTSQMQLATFEGEGLRGRIEFWGESPDNMRVEITSDTTEELDGMVLGGNSEQGWAYIPARTQLSIVTNQEGEATTEEIEIEPVLYIADYSLYNSNFGRYPTLYTLVEMIDTLKTQGLTNSIDEAETLRTEEIGGHDTYQVQTKYKASDDPSNDLSSITTIFWIDQKTSLPLQVEVIMDYGELTGSGRVTVEDVEIDETLDSGLFNFEPSEETVVIESPPVDLDTLQFPEEAQGE